MLAGQLQRISKATSEAQANFSEGMLHDTEDKTSSVNFLELLKRLWYAHHLATSSTVAFECHDIFLHSLLEEITHRR